MSASRVYPVPVLTIYGSGWLIGRDPANHQVNVQFTREKCTDAEMLVRFRGDNWTMMIPEEAVIHETA